MRIVLVGTQHPGNIGAAARAMKTMGLHELALVAPLQFPDPQAEARAAGAGELLAAAQVHRTLPDAVGDCVAVLGCSARRRGVALEELAPEAAAQRLLVARRNGPVALLFGRERTGLSNDELQLCQAMVRIPSDPAFGSLNLAAAVQVLSYELRLAAMGAPPQAPSRRDRPATLEDLEGLFGHLERALQAIDFHKGRSPRTVLRRLRRLYLRAGLDQREVRILRGILAEAERMAALAGAHGRNDASPEPD